MLKSSHQKTKVSRRPHRFPKKKTITPLDPRSTSMDDLVTLLMEGLDCARSLTVAILWRYGEWSQLALLQCDPSSYNTDHAYWSACAATDFLRKCRDLPTGIDRRAAAKESFFKSEQQCCKTNLRLRSLLIDGQASEYEPAVWNFVQKVKKKIHDWIGDGPPPFFEGRFGPGATVSDKARASTVPDKMSSVPTLTPGALGFLFPFGGSAWGRAQASLGNSPRFVRYNSFFTVSKDGKTDRGCGKEPSINAYFQLGLGRVLRRLLKKWAGIDLENGQTLHRWRARRASLSNRESTIDLSSASDTVCNALVKLLLPVRWYEVLNALRSPATMVDGKLYHLEKFSSMGNGFTFELETLLFLALATVACGEDAREGVDVLVYGDDIIVPSQHTESVLSVLEFFGFTPNKRKTFKEGAFRESCGGDYFEGVDVRAHFLEEFPDEPQDWIVLANGIRRLATKNSRDCRRWASVRRAWFRCLDNLPSTVRQCRGPEGLGDIVIHDRPNAWTTRTANSIRYFRCYKPVPRTRVRWDGFADEVQNAAALYFVNQIPPPSSASSALTKIQWIYGEWVLPVIREGARDPSGNLIPRDPVLGYKVGWVPFS